MKTSQLIQNKPDKIQNNVHQDLIPRSCEFITFLKNNTANNWILMISGKKTSADNELGV